VTAAGLLILRLTLAFVLVSHGGHILLGWFAGGGLAAGGLDQAAARFAAAGLNPGYTMAAIVGAVQFTSGWLIAIGILARWAAGASLIITTLLLWKLQAAWGFYLNWLNDPTRGHGTEYSIVLIGMLVTLLLTGAGDFSFDGRRANLQAARAAGRARVRGR
jgi:putative oxidoreductase